MIDVQAFLNYGIAGLILWVFYKLFSNELKSLKNAIEKLNVTIEKHNTLLEVLINRLDDDRSQNRRKSQA